jgi:hypothetical protein
MTETDKTPPGSHPTDILMNLIVAFLAPMFLGASGGNVRFARMAAIQTVAAYRARDHVDLIAIAGIIACGLAALGSLSLSFTDDISLNMTLRLRGNAVALNRVAEQNRRTLRETRPVEAEPSAASPLDEAPFQAEVVPDVTAAQDLAANAQVRLQTAEPAPESIVAATPTPSGMPNQQWQAMWAEAMTDVASELDVDLQDLSPEQRLAISRQAAALSSCASQLLSGDVPQPLG